MPFQNMNSAPGRALSASSEQLLALSSFIRNCGRIAGLLAAFHSQFDCAPGGGNYVQENGEKSEEVKK
jgi:hypothetical protein